jgi:chorismate mutase
MRPTITPWPKGGSDIAAPRLDTLREKIDRLDDALLELVERRLSLSLEISALKDRDDARLKLRPRREAEVVRRLTGRGGLATPDLIAHLWRELLSHGLQVQKRTELVLWGKLDPYALLDQVHRRFGWAAPVVQAQTPEDALDQASRCEAIAVIENSPFSHWWLGLANDPALTIFGATRSAGGEIGAFLVGRVALEDVADDECYEVVEEQDLQPRLDGGECIEILRSAGSFRLCQVMAGRDDTRLRKEAAR